VSDLLMIVPSRGRPENVAELIEVWRQTTTGDTRLLIALDNDDPDLDRYAIPAPTGKIEFVVGERLRLGGTLNKLSVERARDHFAVGFMGDDHRPRTEGWDEKLIAELRRLGTGLAYGNDPLQGERLPTAITMTSDIITTLGYMVPPGGVHLYFDDFWLAIGRALDRIVYLPDVIIEHMHPAAGKAEWDERYKEVNASTVYNHDQQVFNEWMASSAPVEVPRLKALLR
jgi:hypothetical protein